MMLMWIIIVLTVASLLTLYLGWRLINPAPLPVKWKVAAWGLVVLLLFGQRLTWFLRRNGMMDGVSNYVDWLGFLFLGLVSILVVLMLLRDLPILVKRIMAGLEKLFVRRSKRPYFIRPNRERRRFVLNASNAVLLAATVPLSGYAVFNAHKKPKVVHNELPISDLPKGLDGFTVAQISDTHIGPTLRRGWMRMVVDEVNGLKPDVIVHTGDLVDGSVDSLSADVQPLADLSAPHGVFFCTGNHEYYSGVVPWLKKVKQLGMTPLNNKHRLLDTGKGRILMAGVTDFKSDRIFPAHVSSPSQAKADAPDHDVSILLAHQPRSIYKAVEAGFDVQLSGHTHGGQYFPYTLAIHLFQPYVRGLHLHGGTLLYVNEGTGYWGPPMRLGAGPEITLHTLKRV
jgi:hypothetical protein